MFKWGLVHNSDSSVLMAISKHSWINSHVWFSWDGEWRQHQNMEKKQIITTSGSTWRRRNLNPNRNCNGLVPYYCNQISQKWVKFWRSINSQSYQTTELNFYRPSFWFQRPNGIDPRNTSNFYLKQEQRDIYTYLQIDSAQTEATFSLQSPKSNLPCSEPSLCRLLACVTYIKS